MVNWNSRMLSQKGQAVDARLEVQGVGNDGNNKQVTLSIVDLPDGWVADPIVIRYPQDYDDSATDAAETDEGSDGDKDAKKGARNRK